MEAEASRILVEQLRANDRSLRSGTGEMIGSMEKYVLTVLPKDVLTVMRAVALDELGQQQSIGNKVSQIIVDNVSVAKRSINNAMRSIRMRFADTATMLDALNEAFRLFQIITRIQSPPKNAIVARRNYHLWLDGIDLGLMPVAMAKVTTPGVLTQESVLRIVGPIVNYGRKLFWNPVGASSKMLVRRVSSKRSLGGVRFLPRTNQSVTSPRFRALSKSTLRKKMNAKGKPTEQMIAQFLGKNPPGRSENAGQIIKRIMKNNAKYRGLHMADGWVEYAPAAAWSKLHDPRVPSFSIQLAKRGAVNI